MSGKQQTRFQSASPSPPPPPQASRRRNHGLPETYHEPWSGRHHRHHDRRRFPDEKDFQRPSDMNLVLCVFRGETSGWVTTGYAFRPGRMTDEELWQQIRKEFRSELEQVWRRIFLFKKVKQVVPIEFTRNDVPKRQDAKDVPGAYEFIHAYRHPSRLRTRHDWVDWFVEFKKSVGPDKTIGLEFVEGIWASKLAGVASIAVIAMIITSVLWVHFGGSLQTVFTVMSFVLSGVAAIVALIALYYQLTLSG